MPDVVEAWVRWAGERSGLAEDARRELVEAAEKFGAQFPLTYAGRGGPDPGAYYLGDLPEGSLRREQARDVLERRTFAMPYVGTRIGNQDFPHLDPSDPDERQLLITGEHPEYQEVLDDTFSEALVEGVNPRLHIAMHEVVANQLWDDDPPEAWQAAQRLVAAGTERHDVLHAIAGLVAEHIWHTMRSDQPADNDAYRRGLDDLGRGTVSR